MYIFSKAVTHCNICAIATLVEFKHCHGAVSTA